MEDCKLENENLSCREVEVIRAIVEFGTIDKAAVALHISPHTVDRHLDNIKRKSKLRYLPQVVGWAASQGWLNRSTY